MEYELNFETSNGDVLPTTGCFLGNGKLAIVNGAGNNVHAERVVISKNIEYKNGQYQPNVIDVFNPYGIEMFSLEDLIQTQVTTVANTLNMDTGIATNRYELRRAGGEESSSNVQAAFVLQDYGTFHIPEGGEGGIDLSQPAFALDISESLYSVRQLPYSSVQTIDCTNVNKTSIRFLHECWTADNLIDVVYENSVKFTGADAPLYIFLGHGKTVDGQKVAFASCYLFENAGAMTVKPMGVGTNLATNKRNFQFNCFDIVDIEGGAFKVHIVTTHLTSDDFEDPRGEVIRIATSICSPHPLAATTTAIASYIRGRHVDAWTRLWETKVNITPKQDASLEERAEVSDTNRNLYSALYHIYACVRENFNVDANPNALPLLDIDGSMIYEADLWLIPMLLILKPEIARGMIEYRYSSLKLATQLAASYGFEGAKVPFVDDIIGYKNNLYYNTSAYVHLFNTCMVAVNTWNYYRMSRDKDWLKEKGFAILKSTAMYLASVVHVDEETGDVTLNNIVGLNNKVSASNNTFTNNLVKLAVKYAIEASYEMAYPVPDQWHEVFNGLVLPKFDGGSVYKLDDQTMATDKLNVLEMLQLFVPGLWENLNRNNTPLFMDIAKQNLDFYNEGKLISREELRPINQALRAILTGVIMSIESTRLTDYMGILDAFASENIVGPWRDMRSDVKVLNRRPIGLPFGISTNSMTTNSMYLLMFIQGILQMRIVGGISGTRFYYEDLKVRAIANATMPPSWAFISVTNFGMGSNKGTLDARQNAYDMQYNPPSVGGAYIANGDFSAYTP